ALLAAGAGRAQQGPPPEAGGPPAGGRGVMSHGDSIGFIGFEEGLDGKIVTGAPFSATFSSQTTETLPDGNRIQRSTSGTLARDSQGRIRREMTLPAIGPWATEGSSPLHVIFINDPVAGTRYALDADKKVARSLPPPPNKRDFNRDRGEESDPKQVTTTALGTQTINGVSAQGTRISRTIPAGAIGNEKPITIVFERWFSPDLQVNVLTKRSDPRMGETTYQLADVQRAEPSAALFQVPSDYTIKAGRAGQRGNRRRSRGEQQQTPADQSPASGATPQQP
ncbi:MAG: hypothetical protein WA660_02145, partial [Candidatus Acidiferrales bacterium]